MSSVVRPEPAMVAAKLFCSTQLGLRVERGERLVEQHDVGIDRQGAGERGALPLAAGRLIGIAIGEFGEAAALQFAECASRRSDAGMLRASRPNSTLCRTVRHGSSRSFCSMKPTRELGPDHFLAVQRHRAFARPVESGDKVQQRAFAAAGRADDRHEFALGRTSKVTSVMATMSGPAWTGTTGQRPQTQAPMPWRAYASSSERLTASNSASRSATSQVVLREAGATTACSVRRRATSAKLGDAGQVDRLERLRQRRLLRRQCPAERLVLQGGPRLGHTRIHFVQI